MIKSLLAVVFCGAVATVGLKAMAMDADMPMAPATQPTTEPTTQPMAGPINKFCAVEHVNPVDPKVTVTYKGQVIGFCCSDCVAAFNADPEKYMASMK